jgi:hypothetical protein
MFLPMGKVRLLHAVRLLIIITGADGCCCYCRCDIKPPNRIVSALISTLIVLSSYHDNRGNSEPTYTPSLNVTCLPGTSLSTTNNKYIINAQCSNCRSWSGGSLNVSANNQGFIYAVGPTAGESGLVNLKSDDLGAGLQRHFFHGGC